MSNFMLTDAAIERALTPDRYVAAPGDFMRQIAIRIAKPRQSRLWVMNPLAWQRRMPVATQLLVLLLLLIVLIVGAVALAQLPRRAAPNGHVIVVTGAGLLDIDPQTGVASTLVTNMGNLFGVTRSVDGSLISFWTRTIDDTALHIVDRNGAGDRRVATNVVPEPVGQGQVDVWSSDGRFLAAGVTVDGVGRILVVDVQSGAGHVIGPPGAANPLWSPDGRLLGFSYPDGEHTILAVMHPDGSAVRTISGDLDDGNASGTNNFSPDGAWVYFGAERGGFARSNIYRANVQNGYSEQLTFNLLSAAPALSPDGTTVTYSDWPNGRGTQNLMLMDADGSDQHVLLRSALNDGWSNDGEFVLAEWRPPGADFELVVLHPDGSDQQTLMTFEGGCVGVCVSNLGWGQPRP